MVYKSTTLSSLELWLYIYRQKLLDIEQSFKNGLFRISTCMYVFQGTRKDLFSHSSTFSFFSTEFCQQKKTNNIWHSRHHLYQSFLLNMLKKSQRHLTKNLLHLFDVALQSLVYSTSYTLFFFCPVRALTPVVLSCTRGPLKTARGVKLAPLTHPANLKKHCRGTSQTGSCR